MKTTTKKILRPIVEAIIKFEKQVFFATGYAPLFLREWWKFDGLRIQRALDEEHGLYIVNLNDDEVTNQ